MKYTLTVLAVLASATVHAQSSKKVYTLTPQQQAALVDVDRKLHNAEEALRRETDNRQDTREAILRQLGINPNHVVFLDSDNELAFCVASVQIVDSKFLVFIPKPSSFQGFECSEPEKK